MTPTDWINMGVGLGLVLVLPPYLLVAYLLGRWCRRKIVEASREPEFVAPAAAPRPEREPAPTCDPNKGPVQSFPPLNPPRRRRRAARRRKGRRRGRLAPPYPLLPGVAVPCPCGSGLSIGAPKCGEPGTFRPSTLGGAAGTVLGAGFVVAAAGAAAYVLAHPYTARREG